MRLRFSYKMQFKVLFCLNVLIIYEIGHFVNDKSTCKWNWKILAFQRRFFSRILIIFYGKFNIRALKFVNTA